MTQERCFELRGFRLRFSEGIDLLPANVSSYGSELVVPKIGLQTGILSLECMGLGGLTTNFSGVVKVRKEGGFAIIASVTNEPIILIFATSFSSSVAFMH